MSSGEAFVTLATNDSYALGALVLGHSLREVGTTRQLAIMITNNVSEPLRQQINALFNSVTFVDVLNSNDTVNLELLTRPDLGVTFTKLHCWRLTQFSKCVFLDADALVVQNIDDLFEREELSASPDVGWPDCFNSGVFVFRPSIDTYRALLAFAVSHGSFDGGDQGLLNAYFSDWATKDISKRLPFVYNVVSQAFYSYLPAYRRFAKDVKVLHFIGATKPWHLTYNVARQSVEAPSGDSGHGAEFLQHWWRVFMQYVKPTLSSSTIQLSGDLSRLTLYTTQQLGDEHRQYSWEKGQVDYMGIDSFENIQRQIDAKLSEDKHAAATTTPPRAPSGVGMAAPVSAGIAAPAGVGLTPALAPAKVPEAAKVQEPVKVKEPVKVQEPMKVQEPVKAAAAAKAPQPVTVQAAAKAPEPAKVPVAAPAVTPQAAAVTVQAAAKAPVTIQAAAKAPVTIQAAAKAPVSVQAAAKAPVTVQAAAKAPEPAKVQVAAGAKAPAATSGVKAAAAGAAGDAKAQAKPAPAGAASKTGGITISSAAKPKPPQK